MNEQQELSAVVDEVIEANNTSPKLTEEQQKLVRKMADKHHRKHGKEIKRLSDHARDCLITNNKDGYIYSIEKLRLISMQPKLDLETLETLFLTSKQQTDKILSDAFHRAEQESKTHLVPQSTGKSTPVCAM